MWKNRRKILVPSPLHLYRKEATIRLPNSPSLPLPLDHQGEGEGKPFTLFRCSVVLVSLFIRFFLPFIFRLGFLWLWVLFVVDNGVVGVFVCPAGLINEFMGDNLGYFFFIFHFYGF